MAEQNVVTVQNLRALSQAVELFNQGRQLSYIFEDMNETWLTLYTKDKKCPIVEQAGTIVKRNLVRRYAATLIQNLRNTIGLDLISRVIDKDAAFWMADDIIQRISDNKTESHEALFKALVSSIFGVAIDVLNFMLKEEKTKGDLYGVLKQFYDLKVIDIEEDDSITVEGATEALLAYLQRNELTLFEVEVF